jgi:hypothetical protein
MLAEILNLAPGVCVLLALGTLLPAAGGLASRTWACT